MVCLGIERFDGWKKLDCGTRTAAACSPRQLLPILFDCDWVDRVEPVRCLTAIDSRARGVHTRVSTAAGGAPMYDVCGILILLGL